MSLLAIFLGAIGLADIVRTLPGVLGRTWLAGVVGTIAFLLGSFGIGLPWWLSPVAVAALITWLFATREQEGRHPSAYLAVGGLAVAVVAAVAWAPPLPTPAGPAVDWYRSLPYAALDAIDFTTFALTIAGALFLLETSNVIVRLALRTERSPTTPVAANTPPSVANTGPFSRWWRRPTLPLPSDPAPTFTELKGGRFIGPLERLFLLALILSGAFTAMAALVAAKGIIRFPEISKDAVGGSKAEYFLVGSFASWALVLLVALLVALGASRT